MKLNLGSGKDYLEGWTNVDIDDSLHVDVLADLSKKFPFKNSSVSEVKASDILEHFTKEDGKLFLRECHRVLIDGGLIEIRTHNIYEIFRKYSTDPEVLIHFLYGDSSGGIPGSHKFAYTENTLVSTLNLAGFKLISLKNKDTNFVVVARKTATPIKNLNIGIFMQSPDIGGAETFMLSLIRELVLAKNKVYVVSNESEFIAEAKKMGTEITVVSHVMDIIGNYRGFIKTLILSPYFLLLYLKVLISFKKKGINLILASNFTDKLLVTLIAPVLRLPVVWIEYSPLDPVFKKHLFVPKLLYILTAKIPKFIIIPTDRTRDSLITSAKVSLSKLVKIPLGIQLRSKFVPSKDPTIGVISRLAEGKGQEFVIRAMPEVLKKFPNARLMVVGRGPEEVKLKKLVNDLGLGDAVEFPGFVHEIDSAYQKMNIFVFPSVWELEGFGLVTLEAMTRNLPVIASDEGPASEIIIDGSTGFLTDVSDPAAIAQKIIYILENPKVKNTVTEKAYEAVAKNYNIKNVSKKIMEVFNEAICK